MQVKERIDSLVASLSDEEGLEETIERIQLDNYISTDTATYMREHLHTWIKESADIIKHLGVHLGISLLRRAIPVPFAGGARMGWTLSNKTYHTLQREYKKAGLHSWKVAVIGAIPLVGPYAYTLPLREKSEYLPYLYSQHLAYQLQGKSFEELVPQYPAGVRDWIMRTFVPLEIREYQRFSLPISLF